MAKSRRSRTPNDAGGDDRRPHGPPAADAGAFDERAANEAAADEGEAERPGVPGEVPPGGRPDRRESDTDAPWSDRRQSGPDGASKDRRQSSERRSGQDRREPGDRRSGHDRRSGRDRRVRDVGPPPGVPERRSGLDRRQAERRSGRDRRDETGWAAISLDRVTVEPFEYEDVLVDAARAARARARARYSGFRVGAALETIDGQIITGCNVENASYGLTMCAERVALFKALSDGHEVFTRLVVVADSDEPTPPCGPCRQLLWEYCGDIQVILASPSEVKRRYQLGRLLPVPFDHRLLK